jgi:hypothetical protein
MDWFEEDFLRRRFDRIDELLSQILQALQRLLRLLQRKQTYPAPIGGTIKVQ